MSFDDARECKLAYMDPKTAWEVYEKAICYWEAYGWRLEDFIREWF